MRVVALIATGLGLFLLAASAAFRVSDMHREQSRSDGRLSTAANDEAVRVEQYFDKARSTILLTAHNPAFRSFYRDTRPRLAKIRERTQDIREAEGGLAYIEQLYASSISEICFIDHGGG